MVTQNMQIILFDPINRLIQRIIGQLIDYQNNR